jgi:hypothetical protein
MNPVVTQPLACKQFSTASFVSAVMVSHEPVENYGRFVVMKGINNCAITFKGGIQGNPPLYANSDY